MSILCCFRGRRTTCREPDKDEAELPVPPPRAELSKSPFPTSEVELTSPPPIIVTRAPSLLHNPIPEATVDPSVLEVEDSDDDEPARSTRNSSSGTLEAIRTRFIRRLSEKSDLRRHSQQSLGTSDEEVARRAELKRLMHKRIQEELKSEEEQDETDTNADKLGASKSDVSANVELPGGGPRDSIEFSVSDVNETGSKDATCTCIKGPADVILALPVSNSQPKISLRRSSFPGSNRRSHDTSLPESTGTLRERGSLPQIPSSPQLVPINHRTSIRGSDSLCSWRLSYSAEQAANYLGVPDDPQPEMISKHTESITQGEDVHGEMDEPSDASHVVHVESSSSNDQEPETNGEPTESIPRQQSIRCHDRQHDTSIIEDSEGPCTKASHDTSSGQDSPLDLWLRSQEWQSASLVSSRRTSDMILQMNPESSNIDERLMQSESINEPQVLTSDVRTVSDPLFSNHHSPPGAWPLSPGTELSNIRSKEQRQPSGVSSNASDYIGHARDVSSSYYASSRYTTRPNSCQTTTKESRLSLIGLLGGQKAIPQFSGFSRGFIYHWTGSFYI